MKLQVEVALACLIGFLWFQNILCDGFSGTSGISNWKCICSSAFQRNDSVAFSANCSSSCDCSPAVGGSSGNRWTCTCAADRLPKVSADGQGTSCFTACTCNFGYSSETDSSKKHNSKKVVIILLLCVAFTTLAFIASVIFYFYRKDKCPIQQSLFSSDKETSCNSATNLISDRAKFVPETRIFIDSYVNPFAGCIHKASILLRSNKAGTIHGTIKQFSYSELESATNKFSDSKLIGIGGSSHVYCGLLRDGRTVAIKRLRIHGGPDTESMFLTEMELISRLHHCHVVPLIGYCSEFQGKHAERLLVYEYMSNGNLRECLDEASGKLLDWNTRVAIALGAARGLEYLHEAAAPRILHRDVKSTNVLLDGNWRAKITDLGMAKHIRTDGLPSCSTSPARMQGTFGYFAPEYAIVGRASLKSDVFSFGVVLLELISGLQPIYKSTDKGEESLVIWATPRLQDSKLVIAELPDPKLKGDFPEEEMQIMAYLAKECLLLDPDSRPTMSEVVQILSTIAPEKSTRRKIPANLFQGSYTYQTKSSVDIERPIDKEMQNPSVDEELKRISSGSWAAQYSSPVDMLYVGNNENKTEPSSPECMEKVILQTTSNSCSLGSQDDKAADLIEPQFESFCMENVHSR